jgi:hypothetical protein
MMDRSAPMFRTLIMISARAPRRLTRWSPVLIVGVAGSGRHGAQALGGPWPFRASPLRTRIARAGTITTDPDTRSEHVVSMAPIHGAVPTQRARRESQVLRDPTPPGALPYDRTHATSQYIDASWPTYPQTTLLLGHAVLPNGTCLWQEAIGAGGVTENPPHKYVPADPARSGCLGEHVLSSTSVEGATLIRPWRNAMQRTSARAESYSHAVPGIRASVVSGPKDSTYAPSGCYMLRLAKRRAVRGKWVKVRAVELRRSEWAHRAVGRRRLADRTSWSSMVLFQILARAR